MLLAFAAVERNTKNVVLILILDWWNQTLN